MALAASAQGQGLPGTYPIFRQLIFVETAFEIRVNNIKAEVPVQGITLRAVYHERGLGSDSLGRRHLPPEIRSTGSAGYRAYHLEFLYHDVELDYRKHKFLEFRQGREVIYTVSLGEATRRMSNGNDHLRDVKAFAVSLENVPLTLLDVADTLNFREAD
ncbi:MAG: hypothetical protein ACFB21_00200 [Opitutales bacterium]